MGFIVLNARLTSARLTWPTHLSRIPSYDSSPYTFRKNS